MSSQSDYRGESVVFILSQHRSGSTLLQQVLGGHSQIRTDAEPFVMLHPLYALKTTGYRAEYLEWEARVAVSDFLEHVAGGEETYIEALRAMAAVLYGKALEGTGARYFVDKTPRYTTIIPELHRVLPEAKYIVLLRNPMAILASMLERIEKPTAFQRFTLIRNDTVLAPPRLLAAIDRLGPDAIVVHYEDLVAEPERVVAGICERLGLDFEPAMIDYGDRPPPRGRFYDRRGLPRYRRPEPASLEKWRALADDPQRRHIARSILMELGPEVVERLGYSFDDLLQGVSDGTEGTVVCPWPSLMLPAVAADEYLDALPGSADFPPSTTDRRVRPATPSRISVVIPTHGSPTRFERAVRSVLLQGRPNVEVIVAPDASQPGSDEVVEKYRPWLAAVTEPAAGGFFDAVQRGLECATGDVLTWLRADQEHLPWTLATVGEILSERTEVEWLCGEEHLVLDENGRPVGRERTPTSLSTWVGRPDGGHLTPLHFPFVRRTLWDRAGAH
ncbi:MAG: sulfotransferase, partial [Actinobacteria bacterium]|nr:sulfotransferase [Actinomycetota bacterium]